MATNTLHNSKVLKCVSHFKIVGFSEGSGRDMGTIVWQCETAKGKRFNIRPMGTHEQRSEWFKNGIEYIGKLLTVKYQGLTDDGVPRFPTGKGIRDYE